MDGWLDEWMEGAMDGRTDLNAWVDKSIDEWENRMNG
jgi:hypothetical protein